MTGFLLDTELTEDQQRYAQTIKSSGEFLLGIINDILDFSKIEAGKLELEILEFDLQSLLDDFASAMALKTHSKGLELICATDLDVPTALVGDPSRLRQILTNLTGNAVKFTRQGEIAVMVSRVAEEKGQKDLKSCRLRFSVRDTGIGISQDKRNLLFQKFSQVDASTTRHYGGHRARTGHLQAACTDDGGRDRCEKRGGPGIGVLVHRPLRPGGKGSGKARGCLPQLLREYGFSWWTITPPIVRYS